MAVGGGRRKGWQKERTVDELIGLAKGMVADGEINEKEAELLIDWLTANHYCNQDWPISALFQQVDEMLSDGIIDAQELDELFLILKRLSGGVARQSEQCVNLTTAWPIKDQEPRIRIQGNNFCFTGKENFITRTHYIKYVTEFGGHLTDKVTKQTDILVVAATANPTWIHTSWGLKIQDAMRLIETGHHIKIVSERHWYKHIEEMRKELIPNLFSLLADDNLEET